MYSLSEINELEDGFTYVDGFLEGPDFLAAVAELEERDEREWQLKRQHHLQYSNTVPVVRTGEKRTETDSC
jgi:hypothetical protein